MIAAYCQAEVFAAMTFTGYCNSAVVETWFEKVLIPELKPNQVVILMLHFIVMLFFRPCLSQWVVIYLPCRLIPLTLIKLSTSGTSLSPLFNTILMTVYPSTIKSMLPSVAFNS